MITVKQVFFSIVLVGRQNPQILNHDFLVSNGILPKVEPFFKDNLEEGENPFTEFFSTPPVARIAYDGYSLLVQEDRFQAMDTTGSDPSQSPIIDISKKYFGELLRYTPFTLGGLNLNCDLTFDAEEEKTIDAALGIDLDRANQAFDSKDTVASITGTFPFLQGRMSVVFVKPKESQKPAKVNFNYEFPNPGDLETFLSNLDNVGQIVDYRLAFYKRIGVAD